ncbi:MAG: DNA cytosine methyltransferase [Limnohabitans sp.]|nr:DNA cytosine methyltransferase [Limnohabitans sp.]
MNSELAHDTLFYGITDVSDALGISQKIVRRYIASGELDSIKIKGVYKISQEALENFKNQIEKAAQETEETTQIVNPKQQSTRTYKNNHKDDINWVDVYDNWKKPKKSELTFVDLFSGAGGITKGFELAGLHGICGLDWFPEAGKTYRRNFDHPFIEGDIKSEEKKKEFYDTVQKQLNGRPLNIVAGGFPCQGFSMAGNRIIDDPRNSLYKELLEIVETLQPEFVVCENVTGLRTMLKGKVEEKIIEDFKAAGYEMNVTILRAADYSVPQKRDRVIFIGNRINKTNYHPEPFLSPENYVTTGQAIEDLMNLEPNAEFNHVPTNHRPDMAQRMLELEEGKSLYKGYSDAWKKCPWNEASCTIKENHGGVNIHPKLPRVLTAREMARIQSFPDDFIFEGPKNKQLVQLGNAVPPLLAKAIGLAIRKAYGQ